MPCARSKSILSRPRSAVVAIKPNPRLVRTALENPYDYYRDHGPALHAAGNHF